MSWRGTVLLLVTGLGADIVDSAYDSLVRPLVSGNVFWWVSHMMPDRANATRIFVGASTFGPQSALMQGDATSA